MERIEVGFLENADTCPDCGEKLDDFRKFVSGTRYQWSGWCNKCNRDCVTISGNTPTEEGGE